MSLADKAREWFNHALGNYQRPLTRYSRGLLKSLEMAQEVVQESFLKLWKNGFIEGGEGPLKVWLYRTARNLSIDILRKEGRMQLFNEGDEDKLLCPEELPAEKLEKDQVRAMVLDELENLPVKYQEVIKLKFQEGLSYKEISEITGHGLSQVGTLIHRAVLHLRESIAKGGHNV